MDLKQLSADQKQALDNLLDWKKEAKTPFITLGGYAGTGKTTLTSILRKSLHKDKKKLKVAFCSYTGKATRVLKEQLIKSKSVYSQDSISTIHALIYSPIVNNKEVITGWKLNDTLDYDLIIIDESSMIDESIWADLLSFNIPIIAVGDHGQLPPISGNFNLMEKPILKLEEIHRQAKDNPIIKLSTLARKSGEIPVGVFADGVAKISRQNSESGEKVEELLRSYNNDTLILCGYNTTRNKLNTFIRGAREFESPNPQTGDRVICLKNNHIKNIHNGMVGTIKQIEEENDTWYQASIKMDGEKDTFSGLIAIEQFGNKKSMNFTEKRGKFTKGDLFDFGYALTVHKAQGSESNRVVLFEERFPKMDDEMWRRWLYTGVTRAKEELFVIGQ
ncbi:MAG TPA: hypothetical protein ENI23_09895 [bacterium]|nr:hypothetical protein [bacterium]